MSHKGCVYRIMMERSFVVSGELSRLAIALLALGLAVVFRVLDEAFGKEVACIMLPALRVLWRADRQIEREVWAAEGRLDWMKQLRRARGMRVREMK